MIFGLCLVTPLLGFAIYNFVKYILRTKRYKILPLLCFYVLTIGSLVARSVQFGLQIKYYYCYMLVINIAQTATILRLGAGICHAQILAKLYFDLKSVITRKSH